LWLRREFLESLELAQNEQRKLERVYRTKGRGLGRWSGGTTGRSTSRQSSCDPRASLSFFAWLSDTGSRLRPSATIIEIPNIFFLPLRFLIAPTAHIQVTPCRSLPLSRSTFIQRLTAISATSGKRVPSSASSRSSGTGTVHAQHRGRGSS